MKATIKPKRYPRWKRKRQILMVFYRWGKTTLTMSQVAFWLQDMKPSNHLLKILHEMEGEHMLKSRRSSYRRNATRLNWTITNTGMCAVDALQAIEKMNHAV